ncbi:MAG: hypothetical protein DRP01_00540 [Archaeoglobales archaeon]|nr:MAG: hypothetical protein DRP01_00540 [Archaeoglobales archaeon]
MIIICREDLPFNPDAIKKKYPHSRCWEIEEFFVKAKEDPELYKEARRVFWESYWRRMGYYRGRHRFFDAYEDGKRLTRDEDKMRVLGEIIISAWEHGIVPREVIRMRRIKGWPPAYRRLPRKKSVLV